MGTALLTGWATPVAASDLGPLDLFNQRILPIFRSPNPSSCVQCHLSSVDLKQYILPSSDATFVSLRDQGLIDLQHPEGSKILELIRMGEKDLDVGAKMIHQETRTAELDAFAAWIEACCADPELRDLPASDQWAKPSVPDEVIRHARKSRVVDSFVRNVWSQRMRCFPCHTPHEIDGASPQQQAVARKQQKLLERYDAAMRERLAIFKATPEETLKYLVESSARTEDDRLPLVNLADPAKSLLLLKPMSKLPPKRDDGTFEEPSYREPVSHMGGLKLHRNDQSYKSIMAWMLDYAKVVDGDYKSIEELPADNWYPSQLVVRVKAAPASWPAGVPVQLFVHAWDEAGADWEEEPVAFTQGMLTPRRMVNGALFLLGRGDAAQAEAWKQKASLPKGRYLVKAYVDSRGKVAADPATILSAEDYVGEVEIPKARWRPGFKYAEVVTGAAMEESPLVVK